MFRKTKFSKNENEKRDKLKDDLLTFFKKLT